MSASRLITIQLLAERYAKAIFDLARQKKEDAAVIEDFKKLSESLDKDSYCYKFVGEQYSPHQRIQEELVKIFEDELKICGLTADFLKILIANSRLYILPQVIERFFELLQESNNEMTVCVTSVQSLDKQQEQELANALEKYFNKKIQIIRKIDESILGGIIITAGSKMIDMSLLGKLNFMNVSSKQSLLTEFK